MPGGWWHDTDDGRMVCDLCPRKCSLKPGDRGFCFVRQNLDGEMVLTTYGKSTGFCIDPIEKKPLNHFYPGTSVLSFGTAGCNLGCKFCQNHDISKARKTELLSEHAMPEQIARAAIELNCKSVAYTYNDPIIWAEYAIDTAKACRRVGVKSVAVTAGYISPEARAPFFEFFDAANVDLKAFSEDFYAQVTLSHLQPILDTLQWLKRETDVWFEITNLVIPGANDHPDELRQMCDWILEHVGDRVPVHFSAFHPDFRMLDHNHTPHETLLEAYQIARSVGLRYVYVGNVDDGMHQSTYCDGCGKQVIERVRYALGSYHLQGNECAHCGHQLAGHFAAQPGTWGSRRQPVRISDFAPEVHSIRIPVHDTDMNQNPPPDPSAQAPFNTEQQAKIVRAAGVLVSAAASGHSVDVQEILGELATHRVHGVYVSVKRGAQLRGCCGFTGRETSLYEGLDYAARRTALEDPRFPPVSPSELPYLDLEVWLLGKLLPVEAKGKDRLHAIQVGRDGLFIHRGQQRGLLLPGVATDRDWDEETFLRQVCIKAQLPPTAWREPDTMLQRFEGYVVKGQISHVKTSSPHATHLMDTTSIAKLGDFCRENIRLINQGALPNYYLPGVNDGMVSGILLTARWPTGQETWLMKQSLRSPMPMQTTLFSICENFVRQAKQTGLDASEARVDLGVLEAPAMHGSSDSPDLRGVDDDRALMLVGPGQNNVCIVDSSLSAEAKLQTLLQAADLRSDQQSNLVSCYAQSTGRIFVNNSAQPWTGPARRPPGVAGQFYPATAGALAAMVRKLVPKDDIAKGKWRGAMIPHAGLQYSGAIAAEVLAHLEIPQSVIVIGPKHTPRGVDWAVAPHEVWSLPGIETANNKVLAQRLVDNISHLQFDAAAHQTEHCIEVELPFLHHFAPTTSVVGIAVGSGNLGACREFAKGLAETLRSTNEDVLLLISSDMNHFASDQETRRLDEIAIQALETLDVEHIFHTVRGNEISMCGLLPAVMVLDALHQLAPVTTAKRVRYGTSTDINNDPSRAVGYAGMLFH